MTNVKKAVKKVAINENENTCNVPATPAPKQRASRAKKPKTKEELIKMLLDSSDEIKLIIQELKEDETKIQGMDLKKVPELLKETINNMDEDQKELDEKYQELLSLPEDKSE